MPLFSFLRILLILEKNCTAYSHWSAARHLCRTEYFSQTRNHALQLIPSANSTVSLHPTTL